MLISYVWVHEGGWPHGFAQHLCEEMQLPLLFLGVANGNTSEHLRWRREVCLLSHGKFLRLWAAARLCAAPVRGDAAASAVPGCGQRQHFRALAVS